MLRLLLYLGCDFSITPHPLSHRKSLILVFVIVTAISDFKTEKLTFSRGRNKETVNKVQVRRGVASTWLTAHSSSSLGMCSVDMRLTNCRPRVVERWFYLHLPICYTKMSCHERGAEIRSDEVALYDCYIFKVHKSSVETFIIVLLYLVVIPIKQLLKKDTQFSTNLTCDGLSSHITDSMNKSANVNVHK